MKYVLLSSLYLLILFSVSHFIFEPTYLYRELVWLDIPMHVLGGLGVGFLIIAICRLFKVNIDFPRFFILFLIVAFAWEGYEYMRGVIVYDALYKYLDFIKDIATGTIGVYGAYKLTKER